MKKQRTYWGGQLWIKVKIISQTVKESIEDKSSTETIWGNPITTQDMIHAVKKQGFRSIRIPITYEGHMNNDGKIDEEWLARVKEVVDYAEKENMYCIINVHHDTGIDGWLKTNFGETEKKKFIYIWEQIADYFKDYDEHLMFEGFNEILNANGDWNTKNESDLVAVNELNQCFVDTVRKNGNQNEDRYLIVNTYGAGVDQKILDGFELPKDKKKNHLIVGVHSYQPAEQLSDIFQRLNNTFINKGISVIIGECGYKYQRDSNSQREYIKELKKESDKYNIPFILWDDGGNFEKAEDVNNYCLLNRKTLTWYFPEIMQQIMK